MSLRPLLLSSLSLLLVGCGPDSPTADPAASASPASASDTLRYSIEEGFAGRTTLLRWYHVSFQSPLAVRTLADRPLAQAFALSGAAGPLALSSDIDSSFDFYARLEAYLLDEAGWTDSAAAHDSSLHLERTHRWAMAPIALATDDLLARTTFANAAALTSSAAGSGLNSEFVLLYVRDTLVAQDDGLLRKRKLTGGFGPGWHLLKYNDTGRTLSPASFHDTIRFKTGLPSPNLV